MKALKQHFRKLAEELAKIADEIMVTNQLDLMPGTYRALDIHRILLKEIYDMKQDDFLDHLRNLQSNWENEGEDKNDIRARRTIMIDNTTYRLPKLFVFHMLHQSEKTAGIRNNKVNRWTITDKRTAVYTSSICFPDKKAMVGLSRLVRKYNVNGYRATTFTLGDGYLRGKFTEWSYDVNGRKRIVHRNDSAYRIISSNYVAPNNLGHLSFRIEADQIKHIYGECKVSVYMDNDKTERDETSKNIRIVFENKDGWTTSTDIILPITEEAIQRLDSGFISDDELQEPTTSTISEIQESDTLNDNRQTHNNDPQEDCRFKCNSANTIMTGEGKLNRMEISSFESINEAIDVCQIKIYADTGDSDIIKNNIDYDPPAMSFDDS